MPMLPPLLVFPAILICALVLGVALAFSVTLFQRWQNPDPTPTQVRLSALRRSSIIQDVKLDTSDPWGLLLQLVQVLGLHRHPLYLHLVQKRQQAGILMGIEAMVVLYGVLPITLSLMIVILLKGNILFLLLGILTPSGGYGFMMFKGHKRRSVFTMQLPDALTLMTSSLRAGHAFQSALTLAGQELPPPMGPELSLVVNDIALGIPLKEAFLKLIERFPDMMDVRTFVTAVIIQREVGGNLAEILDNVGRTVRQRIELRGQVSALTSQSRFTGFLVGSLPFIMLAVLSTFFYSYEVLMYTTMIGNVLLVVVVILEIIGFYIIHRILDIKL